MALYADDICVVAPTTIALQKLLDVHVCYEYGTQMIWNTIHQNLHAWYLSPVALSYIAQLLLL